MSQADSPYTTSLSNVSPNDRLRRRQFVTGGTAALAAAFAGSPDVASGAVAPDPILTTIEGDSASSTDSGDCWPSRLRRNVPSGVP